MEEKKIKIYKPFRSLCVIVNAENALSYDIGFIGENFIPDWVANNKKLHTSEYSYVIRDRETLKESELIKSLTFRVRLRGVENISRQQNALSVNATRKLQKAAKNLFLEMSKDCEGVFICDVHRIDDYNRLLVDIYHPVTGVSAKEVLLKEFPSIFCPFRSYGRKFSF